MTPAGWILMIACWAVIVYWTFWCFRRVLVSKRHWTNPEDDITQLRHGEFGDDPKE